MKKVMFFLFIFFFLTLFAQSQNNNQVKMGLNFVTGMMGDSIVSAPGPMQVCTYNHENEIIEVANGWKISLTFVRQELERLGLPRDSHLIIREWEEIIE